MVCACSVVKKLSRRLVRQYDEQLKGSGLNSTQFPVLRVIARRAGEPLAQMADELEMDRTSLYRAIDPMLREGWIIAEEGNEPGTRTARLTPKGRRVLQKAEAEWSRMQSALVGRFGQQRYKELLRDLHSLAECLNEMTGAVSDANGK